MPIHDEGFEPVGEGVGSCLVTRDDRRLREAVRAPLAEVKGLEEPEEGTLCGRGALRIVNGLEEYKCLSIEGGVTVSAIFAVDVGGFKDGKLARHGARVCVDPECILMVGEADDILPVHVALGVGMLGLDGDVGRVRLVLELIHVLLGGVGLELLADGEELCSRHQIEACNDVIQALAGHIVALDAIVKRLHDGQVLGRLAEEVRLSGTSCADKAEDHADLAVVLQARRQPAQDISVAGIIATGEDAEDELEDLLHARVARGSGVVHGLSRLEQEAIEG